MRFNVVKNSAFYKLKTLEKVTANKWQILTQTLFVQIMLKRVFYK